MNRTTKKNLQIAGIATAAGTLLFYAGMQLYKMYKAKKQNDVQSIDEETHRSFAPSYLGKHKPHHRKAKSNGQAHSVEVS